MATATPTNNSVTIEWGPVTDANGYKLQIFHDAAGLNPLQVYDAPNNAGYLDETRSGLTANTQYWYRVSSYIGGVIPDVCDIKTFTTTA